MWNLINSDFYRYTGKKLSFWLFIKTIRVPGFWFMFIFRVANNYSKFSPIGLFMRFLWRMYSYRFGFQIPLNTLIGSGFYIGHYGTLVISSRCKIGNNCNVSHGVTIGAIIYGNRKGAPVLGDFVWIGTNAIVVGGIKIGSNVLIGPGAFVNFDVPDNSMVLGNPGKIIPKDNPIENYIKNVL